MRCSFGRSASYTVLAAILCSVAASTFTNPLLSVNSPDPGVLLYKGTYYAVTTSGDDANTFPIFVSSDLVSWKQAGYIFPSGAAGRPKWAVSDFWAPELHVVGDGIVAYFAARHSDGQLSVGAATANGPLGPFTDVGAPLVHESNMGHIDPTFFNDNGQNYLIWKQDGNALGQHTPIYQVKLSENGTAVESDRITLITNDLPWEGVLVEAPWLVKQGDKYVLFYSGNMMASYAIGVASATSVSGPYTKLGNPILHSASGNPSLVGPGHCSVLTLDDGNTAIFYHVWKNVPPINFSDPRFLSMDRVNWTGDAVPSVNNGSPSDSAQPVP